MANARDRWTCFCELTVLRIQKRTSAAIIAEQEGALIQRIPRDAFLSFSRQNPSGEVSFFELICVNLARQLRNLHSRSLSIGTPFPSHSHSFLAHTHSYFYFPRHDDEIVHRHADQCGTGHHRLARVLVCDTGGEKCGGSSRGCGCGGQATRTSGAVGGRGEGQRRKESQ